MTNDFDSDHQELHFRRSITDRLNRTLVDASVHEKLFTLREQHPEVAFEVDEVLRALGDAVNTAADLIVFHWSDSRARP